MKTKYALTPTIKHYNCVVEAYGRAGRLAEAEDYISKMPLKPDVITWTTLLRGCLAKNDVKMAERAAESARKLNPKDNEVDSLMASIYRKGNR